MPPVLEVADVATPIGTFRVVYEGRSVRTVDLLERGHTSAPVPDGARRRRPPFAKGTAPHQLAEYFRGERRQFDLTIEGISPSPFDQAVYRELAAVAPGETVTYGELARRAGHAGAARAVGGTMRRNPIPIVMPCHRVVGEDGSLTGFGLGLWRKRWLLDREGAWPVRSKSAEGPNNPAQRTLDDVTLRNAPRPRAGRPRPAAQPA
jgi:methylated-DNA-[protein]-cysteine S-methyltransferase